MPPKYILICIILIILLSSKGALAQGGYTLTSGTIHGASIMVGGDYFLTGVAGQSETGTANGGQFTVISGLNSDSVPTHPIQTKLYLPFIAFGK